MDLNDVADELAIQLAEIDGLKKVFAYPPDNFTPPVAIVSYPEQVDFDETYGRGMDRIQRWPVVLAVGKVTEKSARLAALEWASGSGTNSVKQVIEAHNYVSCNTVRVASCEFDVYTIGGIDYLSVTFMLDIAGSGA